MYISPDTLEGDNKYHCDKYNKKIDAQRRTYIGKPSNTMVFNLKRFEYDYNTMQRKKINDFVEFPEIIDLKPWTKEGIEEEEKRQSKHVKQGNM